MWPSQDTGLWNLGQGDQETREGQCPAGNTVRMRVLPSRTHPGGHTDDLLEAQTTSTHLWKQARMWAAFKLTLLISEDRQIIKIKQVIQNESTTKLASSWPTPWQRGGHQELEGLTCEKKTKDRGSGYPAGEQKMYSQKQRVPQPWAPLVPATSVQPGYARTWLIYWKQPRCHPFFPPEPWRFHRARSRGISTPYISFNI